jgi:PTH1 family peptidyl-tRNA hydrolase
MSIELVIGLGNPGRRYIATRHNLGFRVADELVRRHGDADWARTRLVHITSTHLDPRLILAKPRTYMNRSGGAVEWLLEHLGFEPEQALVVVDDVELPFAGLRLRRSGGPGTHNGLRDICDRIGTSFPRLRLGVQGHDRWDDLAKYVLSPFTDDEEERVPDMISRAADAVVTAFRDGLDRAMSIYNRTDHAP